MRASGPFTGFVATPAFIVNMRQQDGHANVLANPRIRVKNREKARVHIGDRVPVVTTTSTANVGVSASVSYLDVGLKLEVEPTIHLEGDVAIKVGLEVSNIVREVPITGGGIAYRVGTRNATTILRLRDGETQVLAGLIQDEERATASKLPGVGDLPVVGRLFSSNLGTRDKTEIVLLITPRIVRALSRADYVKAEFYAGTEAAVGAPPLSLGPTEAVGVMATGTPGSPAAGGKPSIPAGMDRSPPAIPPAGITVALPPGAKLGSEVTASIMQLSSARGGSTEFDLVYDPAALAPVGAEGRNGRIHAKLSTSASGPARYDMKFRVIAAVPGATQLRAENVVTQDAAGGSVAVAAPPAQTLQLVP
jgi:general secretion pathway protein D